MRLYAFREGFRATIDAESAALELERIRTENQGRLIPKDIVRAAEPENAPLHPEFEWRDGIAADRYRQWQARNLIRAVRIVSDEPDGTKVNLPLFVHTRSTNSEGKEVPYYQSAQIAVTIPDEWLIALQEADAKLRAARKAVADLERIAVEHPDPDDPDRRVRLTIAARAIDVAVSALRH